MFRNLLNSSEIKQCVRSSKLPVIILPLVLMVACLTEAVFFTHSNSLPSYGSYYHQNSYPSYNQISVVPEQGLLITSVTKGLETVWGIELLINVTFYSSTTFVMDGVPYISPCTGSVKLLNGSNWYLGRSVEYFCPLISHKSIVGPGIYDSYYPVKLVPYTSTKSIPFPAELKFQVSLMNNEFTSPVYTAKF